MLHGMANVLHSHDDDADDAATLKVGAGNANNNSSSSSSSSNATVTAERYWELLQQFAKQHTESYCALDTASPPGSGHISENIHPHLGYWNTRQWRYLAGQNDYEINKGKDYFHSSFIDLVITGLLGFKATRETATGPLMLVASPLLPKTQLPAYFAIDGIRTAAHDIALVWDADGSRYARVVILMTHIDDSSTSCF